MKNKQTHTPSIITYIKINNHKQQNEEKTKN